MENKDKKIHNAIVSRIEKVSKSSYLLEIDINKAIEIKPGQFISIYCNGLTLRRPFSVYSQKENIISILFKERGEGTNYLRSLKEGDLINLIGPMGNGFSIKNKKSLLIGAGIGIAPVHFLKTELDKRGIENILACGFLNKEEIPIGTNINKIYTDDGSQGEKGSILNYTGLLINEYKPEIIYSCGPEIVNKSISRLSEEYGIETQIAVEKVMACSIGVCRGCVIDIKRNGKIINASVCKDGPIFDGREVVWQ